MDSLGVRPSRTIWSSESAAEGRAREGADGAIPRRPRERRSAFAATRMASQCYSESCDPSLAGLG